MSLYDKLNEISNYQYYQDVPALDLKKLNSESALRFIKDSFSFGCKDDVFDVLFKDNFAKKGKHTHTVILYLMGLLFQDMFDKHLEDYINRYIPKNSFPKYNFKYIWYLACLYHDTASIIERPEQNNIKPPCDLNYYLNNYNVENNLYKHKWLDSSQKPYTYSENLVKNYFKFKAAELKSIDHGIIAGYILYDRLVKIYKRAWEEYIKYNPTDKVFTYEYFEYKNLIWSKKLISIYAIVADSIIAHNIWHLTNNKDIEVYKKYELYELIGINNRIKCKHNSLTFMLGLLDSLEPTKRFENTNETDVLKEVNMECINNTIRIYKPDNNEEEQFINKWSTTIEDTGTWLDVEVESNNTYIDVTIQNP